LEKSIQFFFVCAWSECYRQIHWALVLRPVRDRVSLFLLVLNNNTSSKPPSRFRNTYSVAYCLVIPAVLAKITASDSMLQALAGSKHTSPVTSWLPASVGTNSHARLACSDG
jgi:hypothetical protein